jgi:branched-chain amino acid transport system ATP-binding protein
MLIEVDDIHVAYGETPALKGVSLTLDEGSVVALIGANGAGKTTTLRTISGLKSPKSGNVIFKDRKITGMPPYKIVKLGIGHVPEGRRLFPQMTVIENLHMGAYLRKDSEARETVKMIYEHFPILGERRNQLGGSLSGGEQQMLAMGRALMGKPEVLLLDEPSIGLSPIMVREIAKIVVDITTEFGVSIILVEQNARMAFQLAEKAYVLATGEIVMSGLTKDLAEDEGVKTAYLGV